jgi:hypothetical protein
LAPENLAAKNSSKKKVGSAWNDGKMNSCQALFVQDLQDK